MNLMPLADYLQDNGLGTQGTDLFVHMMPAEADRAMLLRVPLSGTKINYDLPGFFKTSFQLIVRVPAAGFDDGEQWASDIIAALTLAEVQIGDDHFFNYCRPRTEPVPFPLSKGNLIEFNVMFDCCFVKG
jgi:hypothetical protein